MSLPEIKLPWIAVEKDLPHDGRGDEEQEEVLWMDCDGSYHLAKWDGKKVRPVVYGGAPDVEHNLSDYRCWKRIKAPEVY